MPHDLTIVTTISLALGLALIFGFIASWLRQPVLGNPWGRKLNRVRSLKMCVTGLETGHEKKIFRASH